MRSAPCRIWPLRLFSSGTMRRRPNIVSTNPFVRACSIVASMNVRTRGNPPKYASMNSCADSRRDADVARKREGRLSVQQRVVDDLRPAPQLVLVEAAVRPEHLQRRAVVNVFAAPERLDQRFFLREVREHAQLDLRVVGRDQHEPGIGDERAPDLAAEIGADRDVLQVRDRCC